MASICTSNLTSGFIDLATYDELEKYMYGGPDATAYFVRETRKATWFTQVPTVLSRASGTAQFGQTWSVSISRAGDYLLNTWLRVQVPQIVTTAVIAQTVGGGGTSGIGWVPNLMHNLVAECCLTFNDLVAARFDSHHLDFWAAFTVPAGKQVGYNNMIGNIPALTTAVGDVVAVAPTNLGPANGIILNLPLPFFYARDSGVALPTAALPYNDMRINFTFRPANQLVTVYENNPGNTGTAVVNTTDAILGNPQLTNVQVWAEYAIVSNDERKRMACAPRDILIEQVQTSPIQAYQPANNPNPSFDIRFSHAIKVLFFSVINNTGGTAGRGASMSNYTTTNPTTLGGAFGTIVPAFANGVDPIFQTSLIYENTARLATMGSDYFSLVNPYYHAPVIPAVTGFHSYSYSLDFICLDPLGSTNYGKLTNVSIVPAASAAAVAAAGAAAVPLLQSQTYSFIVTAVNNNIIRISGGALGFPVL